MTNKMSMCPRNEDNIGLLYISFVIRFYEAPYEWHKFDERVRRLTKFNMFKSEIKTLLFLHYFDN